MGEKKRKIEAVLNGPCPCGSAKPARSCCFTNGDWHKSPTILGLRALPPTGRVENCYMKELGSCEPPISAEHIISKSVSLTLMGEGDFSIAGVPWLEAGEEKIIAPPVAKCLCRKHNSMLHPLDDAANYFFASLKEYLDGDRGSKHALVSGHDIERWLLKTAKAAAASKNLAMGRKSLSGIFSQDAMILDMLDDPRHWPEGAGLYGAMNTGDLMENHARFQLQPFTNDEGEIETLGFNIMGLRFALLLEAPDFKKYPLLIGAKYRPGKIEISYPGSTNWITMSWDDGRKHDRLTMQWVRNTGR